jgi:nitrate reductase delta subunit
MRTYRALAALISYPTAELQAAVRSGEIKAAIEGEGLLAKRDRVRLDPLLEAIRDQDLLDLQAAYVDLFDRSRSRSLHLFEHVFGESRDRGPAMVELQTMYAEAGLDIAENELPDYLPLYLEYCSVLTPGEARDALARPIHVVSAVRARLAKRESAYAGVFQTLETLAASKADPAELEQLLAQDDDDPNDTQQLDAAWSEEPVTFGPDAPGVGGNSCGRIKQLAERAAQTLGINSDAARS